MQRDMGEICRRLSRIYNWFFLEGYRSVDWQQQHSCKLQKELAKQYISPLLEFYDMMDVFLFLNKFWKNTEQITPCTLKTEGSTLRRPCTSIFLPVAHINQDFKGTVKTKCLVMSVYWKLNYIRGSEYDLNAKINISGTASLLCSWKIPLSILSFPMWYFYFPIQEKENPIWI